MLKKVRANGEQVGLASRVMHQKRVVCENMLVRAQLPRESLTSRPSSVLQEAAFYDTTVVVAIMVTRLGRLASLSYDMLDVLCSTNRDSDHVYGRASPPRAINLITVIVSC